MTNPTVIQNATIHDVADYFLDKGNMGTEEAITHLKLQKLVYYAQAWYVALNYGKKLFDSRIEAWMHGPVCPELYNEYRNYGYKEIERPTSSPEFIDGITEVLESVWEVFGSYDGKFLEELTHSEDPWINARKGLPENATSNKEIKIDDMKNFYSDYLN
ncbi:Panacea domain-containing protein [Halobacillus seohaensis]|uniref:Panacea domain-containing protein n=1 Tax=Halobacillus seohaensis TaxID=447421 RepID=A0ABW2EK01_9BACI